ncbi:MAG: PKD domain-containing protein [Deltaproteobacteria bacterium]|nr:PKD domain-containing protein [Deltaproteobacteria bacterium]
MKLRTLGLLLPLGVACSPAAPTADAGFMVNGAPGQAFLFDGSQSSGDSLTFSWSVVDGPASAELYDADTAWPTLLPDAEGVYTLNLTVCDARGACDEAETFAQVGASASSRQRLISAASLSIGRPHGGLKPLGDNDPPQAEASARRSFASMSTIKLDGSASSDPNGDTLRYRWRFVSRPADSALTDADIQDNTSALASFTADVEGTWQVKLTVRDQSHADAVLLPDIVLKTLEDSTPWDDLNRRPGALRGLNDNDPWD